MREGWGWNRAGRSVSCWGQGCKCPCGRTKVGEETGETGARQVASWTGTRWGEGPGRPGGQGSGCSPSLEPPRHTGPGLRALRVFKGTERLICTCSLDFQISAAN